MLGYPGTRRRVRGLISSRRQKSHWKIGFSNDQVSLYGSGVFSGLEAAKKAHPGMISGVRPQSSGDA